MKGLDALRETAIQTVEALLGKNEPLRNEKINELMETRQFRIIKKELKALEIIKSKVVHTRLLMQYNDKTTVDDYNRLNAREDSELLTQEDFDLLREVLL